MTDKSRFPDPTQHFPQFYSFIPDENTREGLSELHYTVFGPCGPVYVIRIDSKGEKAQFETTMFDMWMEDRALGLKDVSFEESAWSDYYYRGEQE